MQVQDPSAWGLSYGSSGTLANPAGMQHSRQHANLWLPPPSGCLAAPGLPPSTAAPLAPPPSNPQSAHSPLRQAQLPSPQQQQQVFRGLGVGLQLAASGLAAEEEEEEVVLLQLDLSAFDTPMLWT